MHRGSWRIDVVVVSILAGILSAAPALAEKPAWAGGEKGQHPKQSGMSDGRAKPVFNEQSRASIQDYFADQYRRGHCPPGLAKKNNGCMAPGQAKKWMIGRPLPRDVIFHDLPAGALVVLGPPPSRHRYVRVAQDILLIATGTGMVVDAIENLSWEFSR